MKRTLLEEPPGIARQFIKDTVPAVILSRSGRAIYDGLQFRQKLSV
jgi:hypothetical protein